MNQPIEAISCCNCTSCQGYMKELEKRVQVLESYLQADPAFLPYGQLEKGIGDLERDRGILSTAVAELQRVTSEFIRMQAQKVRGLEEKLKYGEIQYPHGPVFHEVYTRLSKAECRVIELEGKVESLTRTLDLLQEVIGIEVLVSVTGEAGDV